MLDGANSINAATPASSVLYGGKALHWSSQQDWHAAAGRTIAMASGASAGLYAQQGGIQAIAQAGPVSIQAHQGLLHWSAQDGVTVTSSGEDVELLAQDKITLAAGQVAIELQGQNITLSMPATLDIKGAAKYFVGPAGTAAQLPQLPQGELAPGTLQLDHRYHDDEPLAGAPYTVLLPSGQQIEGRLDGSGQATIANVPAVGAQVSYGPAPGRFQRKDTTATPGHTPDPDAGHIDGLLDKYLGTHTAGDPEPPQDA